MLFTITCAGPPKREVSTIDTFNLNHPSLVEQRATVAIQVKYMYKQLSLEQLIDELTLL